MKKLFKRDLILGQEYLAFLLLNVFDLFLTGYIFSHNGMEANGVAAFILQTSGKTGFAVYKFLMVIIIIVICEVVGAKSVEKARWIMRLGCAVYFFVVLYESYIIFCHIALPSVTPDDTGMIAFAGSLLPRFI